MKFTFFLFIFTNISLFCRAQSLVFTFKYFSAIAQIQINCQENDTQYFKMLKNKIIPKMSPVQETQIQLYLLCSLK